MEVTFQTSNNDCGVSVLISLHRHLYFKEISKEQVLKDFELYDNGLSIQDLEILARDINIELTSYEASFKDILDIYYKEYFVSLFKSENGNHYVICKLRKRYVEVIDSSNGNIKMSFEEFERVFTNIFITFQKTLVKQEIENCSETFKNIKIFEIKKDYLFIFTLITLNLMILMFSLIGSSLIKLSIDFINNSIPQNLIFIGIYFFIVFLIIGLMQYLISLIKIKKISNLTKRNIVFYTNYLSNKRFSFFDKSNKKKLYQYPNSISNVLSVKYVDNPKLISDSIFFVLVSTIITYISIYYMLFAIIYISISLVFSFLLKRFNYRNFENSNFTKNEIDHNFQVLYNFLESEKNYTKFSNMSNICKNSYWLFLKQSSVNGNYIFKNSFLNFILKKIIFILFIIISIFWIINSSPQKIDISKMIFTITLFTILDNVTLSIFEYISNYSNYKKNLDLLNEFVNRDNKIYNSTNKVEINKIESIKLENINFSYESNKQIFKKMNICLKNGTLITGKNGIGKTTLLKIISLDFKLKNDSKLFFNDLSIDEINMKKLEEKIYYLPSECLAMEIDYSGILHLNPSLRKEICDFLKITKISSKNSENLSSGEKQITNLLSLLKVRNSLILLDETFSNVSKDYIKFFMEKFYNKIASNNFVICVSHSEFIKKYFSNKVEIK